MTRPPDSPPPGPAIGYDGRPSGAVSFPEQPANITFGGKAPKPLNATARLSVSICPLQIPANPSAVTGAGGNFTPGTYAPGDYFGELAPLAGLPRSASARARSQASLTGYGVQEFRRWQSGQLRDDAAKEPSMEEVHD